MSSVGQGLLSHEGQLSRGNLLTNLSLQRNEELSYLRSARARAQSVTYATKYPDLAPIDWSAERRKELVRRHFLDSSPGILARLYAFYDSSQQWIVLAATGIAIGITAAAIDVVSQWLSTIRFGHCKTGFYLSRDFCCLGIELGDKCPNWVNWADIIASPAGGYMFAYFLCALLAVTFALIASIAVVKIAPYSQLSGMPEIKTVLGGFVLRRFLGLKTFVVKSIGLCLVVGAGIWVGKEGPLVHLACCCASFAMRAFPPLRFNEARKRDIFTAAAAAGISCAFAAPIGGVIFTLEQLSYYGSAGVMWQSFVCAMVAAVTLQTINPFKSGKLVFFQVVFESKWHKFELIPFAMIGAIGGVYGAAMIKLNAKIVKWRKSVSWIAENPIFEVGAVTLITVIISFPSIYMSMQSSVLLSYLFKECTADNPTDICDVSHWFMTLVSLLVSSSIGFFLTSYSFGMKIPAGILMPSMLAGALGGRAVGLIMQAYHSRFPDAFIFAKCTPGGACITPGMYALVGAAAALTGVTRLTVSTVVIMFELTGALNYVIPIMVATMISKWVGDSFGKTGIYESWVKIRNYPLLNSLNDLPVPNVPIEPLMTKEIDCVEDGSTIAVLKDLIHQHNRPGYPVIKSHSDPILYGYITRAKLIDALRELQGEDDAIILASAFSHGLSNNGQNEPEIDGTIDLTPWMELTPVTAPANSTFHHCLYMVQHLGLRYLLLTTKGRLRGLVTKKDFWRLMTSSDELKYQEENLNIHRRESA
ncbi:anion/proton exchange transporter Gef1p [Trichomonascus vanleenenianus]|uniref:chloride channel protein n=1 Tax=Trichomonascus vanleenenianus TaxID=2268995 RepID=UPI003ECB039B